MKLYYSFNDIELPMPDPVIGKNKDLRFTFYIQHTVIVLELDKDEI